MPILYTVPKGTGGGIVQVLEAQSFLE